MASGEVLFVRNGKARIGTDDCCSTTEDDVWDDTALVEAYDCAVSLAKEEVARRMGLDTNALQEDSGPKNLKNKKKKKNKNWRVGAHCRATYSGDGRLYEATIDSIQSNAGTCFVQYAGYNNIDVVKIKNILPSAGDAARERQIAEATLGDPVEESDLNMELSDGEISKGSSSIKSESVPKLYPNKRGSPRSHSSGRVGPYPSHFPQAQLPPMGLPPLVMPPPPPPPQLTTYFPDEDTEALSAMLMSWYMSGFHTGYYQGMQHYKKSQKTSRRNPTRKT